MPEGHILHRLASAIEREFGSHRVSVTSPQGRFADAAARLDGRELGSADAVGKHLFVDFDDDTVWIHLGLIGKLRFVAADPIAKPETLRLRIARGDIAAELRGPQWCRLITPPERAAIIAKSGPDPLRADADPDRAWAKVRRSHRSIASLLMDQSAFAGVGNIFRAEVLFRHRIDPMTLAKDIDRQTFDEIWMDLVGLMNYAVKHGTIDTVAPAHSPEAMGRAPRVDRHGGEVYVYRRADQPCLVCGTLVAHRDLEGRHLYWCPSCQRSWSSRRIWTMS